MKINLQSPLEEVQIQIIPLIDVVFCVLTFFILAALQFTRQQSIGVDLPKASTGAASQTAQQMLIVSVDAKGQTFVDKKPVTQQELYQAAQKYHSSNPAGMMVLNASGTSTYNNVVQVLDVMRKVGGDRVALATSPSQQPAASNGVTP